MAFRLPFDLTPPAARLPGSPDPRRRSIMVALAAWLGGVVPVLGAQLRSRGNLLVDFNGLAANTAAGTLSLRDMTLRQEDGTLIRAQEASATGVEDGDIDNGQWELRGAVHLEFKDAVLDAEAATAKFVAGKLTSAQVQGSPAQFSHLDKRSGRRRDGRALQIAYDAGSGDLEFAGDTWFFDGRNELTAGRLFYNVNTTDLRDDGDPNTRLNAIIRPDRERVPPPRTPPRGSAQ